MISPVTLCANGLHRKLIQRATSAGSIARRVALPDAFFAADGLFQTFLTVLDEFGAYPAVISRELDRYLPFLATTDCSEGRGVRRSMRAHIIGVSVSDTAAETRMATGK